MTLVAAVFSVLLVCPSSMPADVGSYSAQNCCSIMVCLQEQCWKILL